MKPTKIITNIFMFWWLRFTMLFRGGLTKILGNNGVLFSVGQQKYLYLSSVDNKTNRTNKNGSGSVGANPFEWLAYLDDKCANRNDPIVRALYEQHKREAK